MLLAFSIFSLDTLLGHHHSFVSGASAPAVKRKGLWWSTVYPSQAWHGCQCQ